MRPDSSPTRKRVLKRAGGVNLLVAFLAASALAASNGACRPPQDLTVEPSTSSRAERIALLEHAIASDHATLETLLSRPRADAATIGATNSDSSKSDTNKQAASNDSSAEPLTFGDAEGLHRDPRVRAIAERLTRNRSELSALHQVERVELE